MGFFGSVERKEYLATAFENSPESCCVVVFVGCLALTIFSLVMRDAAFEMLLLHLAFDTTRRVTRCERA